MWDFHLVSSPRILSHEKESQKLTFLHCFLHSSLERTLYKGAFAGGWGSG